MAGQQTIIGNVGSQARGGLRRPRIDAWRPGHDFPLPKPPRWAAVDLAPVALRGRRSSQWRMADQVRATTSATAGSRSVPQGKPLGRLINKLPSSSMKALYAAPT